MGVSRETKLNLNWYVNQDKKKWQTKISSQRMGWNEKKCQSGNTRKRQGKIDGGPVAVSIRNYKDLTEQMSCCLSLNTRSWSLPRDNKYNYVHM